MKVFDTGEHKTDGPQAPPDAPGPQRRLTIRERDALYADGEKVRPEYVMLCNMRADDEWLSIERRDRARFDGDQELVVDLGDAR